MASRMTVMAGKKAAPKAKGKKARSVSIERAENGFLTHVEHEPSEEDMKEPYSRPKPHVSENLAGALDHARTSFGDDEAAEEAAEQEAAAPAKGGKKTA